MLTYDEQHALLQKKIQKVEWTLEEVHAIRESLNSLLPENTGLLVHLFEDTTREYAKGVRCGVCGLTTAQAAAIDYDCRNEC